MGFVDLHVHSNASDGTFSSSQVVELAKNAGLDAFALTDHDTTAGVPEALEKGRDLNIEVIPGIEVSSSFDGTEIHILGLFVNSDDPVLAAMTSTLSACSLPTKTPFFWSIWPNSAPPVTAAMKRCWKIWPLTGSPLQRKNFAEIILIPLSHGHILPTL